MAAIFPSHAVAIWIAWLPLFHCEASFAPLVGPSTFVNGLAHTRRCTEVLQDIGSDSSVRTGVENVFLYLYIFGDVSIAEIVIAEKLT